MSETPTPSKPAASGKGPAKRGGLALPPRGQALARLQDLEEEGESVALTTEGLDEGTISTKDINAVNTASSNAVNHQGSNSVQFDGEVAQAPVLPPATTTAAVQTYQPSVTADPQPVMIVQRVSADSDYQAPVRAAREPTTRITVDMPDSLHQKISVLSAQTRRSIKDLVIEALAATYFGTGTDPQ